MDKYKDKLSGLAGKLKEERPKTPMQQVQPISPSSTLKVPEVQFNNWIPKPLLKLVKSFGVEHDLSLKDINIKALELYLKSKSKHNKNAD